jgi:hypothetical protein
MNEPNNNINNIIEENNNDQNPNIANDIIVIII